MIDYTYKAEYFPYEIYFEYLHYSSILDLEITIYIIRQVITFDVVTTKLYFFEKEEGKYPEYDTATKQKGNAPPCNIHIYIDTLRPRMFYFYLSVKMIKKPLERKKRKK